MSAGTVGALCERVRPELACLGELGASLLATVWVVEAMAGERGVDVLADPSFALEVLMASGSEGDAAIVGRPGLPTGCGSVPLRLGGRVRRWRRRRPVGGLCGWRMPWRVTSPARWR